MGSDAWNREGGGGPRTEKVNMSLHMASSNNEFSQTVNKSVGYLSPGTTCPKCV
jgi:hypothetical protein